MPEETGPKDVVCPRSRVTGGARLNLGSIPHTHGSLSARNQQDTGRVPSGACLRGGLRQGPHEPGAERALMPPLAQYPSCIHPDDDADGLGESERLGVPGDALHAQGLHHPLPPGASCPSASAVLKAVVHRCHHVQQVHAERQLPAQRRGQVRSSARMPEAPGECPAPPLSSDQPRLPPSRWPSA